MKCLSMEVTTASLISVTSVMTKFQGSGVITPVTPLLGGVHHVRTNRYMIESTLKS